MAHTYSPDKLEILIDGCREAKDWAGVLKNVERYVRVFDVGSAAAGTAQLPDIQLVRAYTWSCLGEAIFESKGDYVGAIECVRKSFVSGSDFVDGRIVLCRILLSGSRDVLAMPVTKKQTTLQPLSFSSSSSKGSSGFLGGGGGSDKSFGSNSSRSPRGGASGKGKGGGGGGGGGAYVSSKAAGGGGDGGEGSPLSSGSFKSILSEGMRDFDLSAQDVLAAAFKSQQQPPLGQIPISEQRILLGVMASSPVSTRKVLLAVMDAMSTTEHLIICNTVLMETRQVNVAINHRELLRVWILATAHILLDQVHLDELVVRCSNGLFSTYRFWMFMDAVTTRGLISETLGDPIKARSDAIDMFHETSSALASEKLPEHVKGLAVCAACRIALIEQAQGMFEDALGSFDRCLVADGAIRNSLPLPLLLGLNVQHAISLLMRAQALEVSATDPVAAKYLEDALALLMTTYETMVCVFSCVYFCFRVCITFFTEHAFTHSRSIHALKYIQAIKITAEMAETSQRLSLEVIKPLERSLRHFLPPAVSDPHNVIRMATGSCIAPLLVAILDCHSGQQAQRRVDILEWGCGLDAKPSMDLMWALAEGLEQVGRVDEAIQMLMQCHKRVLDELEGKKRQEGYGGSRSHIDGKNENVITLSLLNWMDWGVRISERYWLPALRLIDLCLVYRSKPQEAFEHAKNGLAQLYPERYRLLFDELGWSTATGVGSGDDGGDSGGGDSEHAILEDNLVRPDCSKYDWSIRFRNDEQSLRFPSLAIDIKTPGFAPLLLQYGIAWSNCARDKSLSDFKRAKQLKESLKVFGVLIRNASQYHPEDDEEEEGQQQHNEIELIADQAALHASVIFAELGEVTRGIMMVKATLLKPNHDSILSSQLLHLLALMLECSGDGDAAATAAAVAMCKQAIMDLGDNVSDEQVQLSSLNIRTTLALLRFSAGDHEAAIKGVEIISSLLIKEGIDDEEEGAEENGSDEEGPEAEGDVENGARPRSAVFAKKSKDKDDFSLAFQDIASSKRLVVDVLLTVARIYRMADDFESAARCIEEAWRRLFTGHPEYNIEAESTKDVAEARRIEILRQTPTLLGWRLPEASGWGAKETLPECEASVLAETAALVQAESGDVCSPRASELYSMALAIFPQHVVSLVELAQMELSRIDREEDEGESLFEAIVRAKANAEKKAQDTALQNRHKVLEREHHSRRAYMYAMRAVNARELDASAWCTLGQAFKGLEQKNEASSALVTAIELDRFTSIRDFSSALGV